MVTKVDMQLRHPMPPYSRLPSDVTAANGTQQAVLTVIKPCSTITKVRIHDTGSRLLV